MAPDNIILTMQRNYNKKSATIYISSQKSLVKKALFYYPLNWQSGNLITNENKQEFMNAKNAILIKDNLNVKWINQSNGDFFNANI